MIIARFEVHQRRADTPVECHCWTHSRAEASAKACELSTTSGANAYVKDTTKQVRGWDKVLETWAWGKELR